MLKKIVIAGSAAAVVLGAGTAALAASGSSSSSSSPASSSAASPQAKKADHAKHNRKSELTRALHASWVTRDGKSKTTFVTHDEIRGTVTAVSPTSITVKAEDNVSETYAVTSSTKVHSRAVAKGTAATIGAVKSGNKVLIVGTGTSTLTATQVTDSTK